jgi:hypothetical protein
MFRYERTIFRERSMLGLEPNASDKLLFKRFHCSRFPYCRQWNLVKDSLSLAIDLKPGIPRSMKMVRLQRNMWELLFKHSYAMFPLFFLQLRRCAIALCRKFLHDLTTARHFKFFRNVHNKNIYNKMGKFQLRGNNPVSARPFHLMGGRAPAQLRGNIAHM